MATYPQQHAPIAIYDREVEQDVLRLRRRRSGAEVDPAHGLVLRPRDRHGPASGDPARQEDQRRARQPDLADRRPTAISGSSPTPTARAGRRSSIAASSRGRSTPSNASPETNFSYGQPWYVPGAGSCSCTPKYTVRAARLRFMTSPDGLTWSEPAPLVKIDMGDYQITWGRGETVASAFDFHPKPLGLDARTNLYYLQTRDLGRPGPPPPANRSKLPLSQPDNPALVHDYQAEKKLVYIKDVNFDADGRPVVLFLTSKGISPARKTAPANGRPRAGPGTRWIDPPVHDLGPQLRPRLALHRARRPLARDRPDRARPQPFGTGGDMVMWTSPDQGADLDPGQAAHLRPEAQPHLRPPSRRRPSRFLRPLGRRRRPRAVRVVPLLHGQARHARLAAPDSLFRRFGPARGGRVVPLVRHARRHSSTQAQEIERRRPRVLESPIASEGTGR